MKRAFRTCDRCGAQLQWKAKQEISLRLVTEENGAEELKDADLCYDCLNGLVKWFGLDNPFTGKRFIKYD